MSGREAANAVSGQACDHQDHPRPIGRTVVPAQDGTWQWLPPSEVAEGPPVECCSGLWDDAAKDGKWLKSKKDTLVSDFSRKRQGMNA